MFFGFSRFARGFFFHEKLDFFCVAVTVEKEGVGALSVASRAADFLIVLLEAFRQIVVDDEADVGFVDAHAEGDGRDHDADLVAEKPLLILGAGFVGKAGVIREHGKSPARELGGHRVDEVS